MLWWQGYDGGIDFMDDDRMKVSVPRDGRLDTIIIPADPDFLKALKVTVGAVMRDARARLEADDGS